MRSFQFLRQIVGWCVGCRVGAVVTALVSYFAPLAPIARPFTIALRYELVNAK
jgi:hypothetical protein